MSGLAWKPGNRVRLLENGEAFFPRVFELLARARREALVETFILFEDAVGRELQRCLIGAARRGLRVGLTVDGYGSAGLSQAFVEELVQAGVAVRWFDPQKRRLGPRTNLFRRLHRKLVLIDDIAFVGGINFSEEHLRSYGPQSKQDYAVELEGPVVQDVRRLLAGQPPPRAAAPAGGVTAALVVRDNAVHRQDIERAYRLGIRTARREITIACAYFFPGYRLLRDLRAAVRRGVVVRLLLQGRPDLVLGGWAARALHGYLLRGGVSIYEYQERALHAKVAVIDEAWSTVGSSNLDPLSLFLNLEANLAVQNEAFTAELRGSLEQLIRLHSREIPAEGRHPGVFRQLLGFLAFHLLRRLPWIVGWLPAHGGISQPVTLEAGGAGGGPAA